MCPADGPFLGEIRRRYLLHFCVREPTFRRAFIITFYPICRTGSRWNAGKKKRGAVENFKLDFRVGDFHGDTIFRKNNSLQLQRKYFVVGLSGDPRGIERLDLKRAFLELRLVFDQRLLDDRILTATRPACRSPLRWNDAHEIPMLRTRSLASHRPGRGRGLRAVCYRRGSRQCGGGCVCGAASR